MDTINGLSQSAERCRFKTVGKMFRFRTDRHGRPTCLIMVFFFFLLFTLNTLVCAEYKNIETKRTSRRIRGRSLLREPRNNKWTSGAIRLT